MIGMALSVLAAVTFSWSVVLVRRSLSESTTIKAALVVACIGNVVLWPLVLLFSNTMTIDLESLLLFSIGGIFAPGIARLLFYRGMNSLGVTVSSAIFSTFPLYSSVMAVFLLNEFLSLVDWIGIILIIVGVVFVQDISSRDKIEKKRFRKSLAFPMLAGLMVAFSHVIRKSGLNISNEPLLGAAVGYASSLFLYVLLTPFWGNDKQVFFSKKDFRLFWKAGLIFAVGWILTFYALSFEKAAIVATLIQIQPLFVAVFAYVYVRQLEHFSMRLVICIVSVVSGVILIGV